MTDAALESGAVAPHAPPQGRSRSWSSSLAIHVALVAASIVMLYPLLWMLASSFKADSEIFSNSLSLWPKTFNFDAYRRGWEGLTVSFGQFFWNSLVISVLSVIGNVMSCSLAAYAFARLNFPGKRFW